MEVIRKVRGAGWHRVSSIHQGNTALLRKGAHNAVHTPFRVKESGWRNIINDVHHVSEFGVTIFAIRPESCRMSHKYRADVCGNEEINHAPKGVAIFIEICIRYT